MVLEWQEWGKTKSESRTSGVVAIHELAAHGQVAGDVQGVPPPAGPLAAFLGYLAMLYSLVVTVRVTETAGGLPRPKALLVVTLLFGLCLFLCLVFLAVLSSLMFFRTVFS